MPLLREVDGGISASSGGLGDSAPAAAVAPTSTSFTPRSDSVSSVTSHGDLDDVLEDLLNEAPSEALAGPTFAPELTSDPLQESGVEKRLFHMEDSFEDDLQRHYRLMRRSEGERPVRTRSDKIEL
jgi:hypothetical protein